MDNLLTLALEAHNIEKNYHRRYEVVLGQDLFEDWTLAIRYGRVGQDGRLLRFGSARSEEVRAIICDRLRRRLSAPKRIGCPYQVAAFIAAPGIDAFSWLPRSRIERRRHWDEESAKAARFLASQVMDVLDTASSTRIPP